MRISWYEEEEVDIHYSTVHNWYTVDHWKSFFKIKSNKDIAANIKFPQYGKTNKKEYMVLKQFQIAVSF